MCDLYVVCQRITFQGWMKLVSTYALKASSVNRVTFRRVLNLAINLLPWSWLILQQLWIVVQLRIWTSSDGLGPWKSFSSEASGRDDSEDSVMLTLGDLLYQTRIYPLLASHVRQPVAWYRRQLASRQKQETAPYLQQAFPGTLGARIRRLYHVGPVPACHLGSHSGGISPAWTQRALRNFPDREWITCRSIVKRRH